MLDARYPGFETVRRRTDAADPEREGVPNG